MQIETLTREQLIEHLKATDCGTPELDALVWWFVKNPMPDGKLYSVRGHRIFYTLGSAAVRLSIIAPLHYTTNLVDALALLPEGPWGWKINFNPDGSYAEIFDPHDRQMWCSLATAPELAFCAAVLKANLTAHSATVHKLAS